MEDEPMFEFPCDYSDVEANFVDYCYDYYGIECGSWRKFATRNEIVLATKIRLLSLSDDDHYGSGFRLIPRVQESNGPYAPLPDDSLEPLATDDEDIEDIPF